MSNYRRPRQPRQYSRADRVSEVVRQIVADELERIGDDRLDLVTVTAVRVDGDLSRARVYYSALTAEAEGLLDGVSEALEEHRRKVQTLVNKQIRARKVPQVEFLPDDVLTHALHIEDVIREMHANGSVASSESAESE